MNRSNDKLARLGSAAVRGTVSGTARALLVAISAFSAHAAVTFGQWTGVYTVMSDALAPLSSFLGLPSDALFVLALSSVFNYYAAFGALAALAPGARDMTILVLMCLISHNLAYETAYMKRIGSSVGKMTVLRLAWALALAWLAGLVTPTGNASAGRASLDYSLPLDRFAHDWLMSVAALVAVAGSLILVLRVARSLANESGFSGAFARLASPLMGVLGLPKREALPWVMTMMGDYKGANALMDARIKDGQMKKQDADLFNHHAAVCHALVEDSALGLVLGASLFWMLLPRLAAAFIVVWVERARRHRFRRSFRVGTA